MREEALYILGLTGAMASGKSTTAALFRRLNVPVFCADDAVHRLLRSDISVIHKIMDRWPQALRGGEVDRRALLDALEFRQQNLFDLEHLLFGPLALEIHHFLRHHFQKRSPLVVLDIPLLFETGLERYCHGVAVVAVAEHERYRRLLRRSQDSRALEFMEGAQIPSPQKEKMADFVLVSGGGRPSMLRQIQSLMGTIVGVYSPPLSRWSPAQVPFIERIYHA